MQNRSGAKKNIGISVLLVVFPIAAVLCSLFVGRYAIRPTEVLAALFSPSAVSRAAAVTVRQLRLPRAIAAAFVGASLSASGAAFQSVFRNPLVNSGILGVSNGAPLEGAEVNSGDTIVILFTNGMTEHGADSAKLIRVLKADGSSVACEVTYPVSKSDDVAKKQFTVKLGEMEGGSYTLVLGADMQANNGNTLGEDVQIAFSVKAAEEPTFFARLLSAVDNVIAPVRNLILQIIAFIRLRLAILWPHVA